jgi:hypothetical protein
MIPHPYVAQCLLCDRNFMTKQELDAHDRVFAAEHDAALSKGGRIDFGKSFTAPVEFVDLLGTHDVPTQKESNHLELNKQAIEPLGGQMEELFGGDARWARISGKALTPPSSTMKGVDPMFADLVKMGV